MNTNLNFTAYLIYLPLVIFLTWYVAYTLFKHSQVFMNDIFNGKEAIAKATNRLMETGFYLLNLGYAFMIMEIYNTIETKQSLLEILSNKIGGFCIYLGIMLFFNLYLFFRGRRKARERARLLQVNASELK